MLEKMLDALYNSNIPETLKKIQEEQKAFSAKITGMAGEYATAIELNFLGIDGKTLMNLYVPKADGQTSEIDVIYITQKGILVIESKNYSGWIYGDEKDTYWTTIFPNKEKFKFYNPIKQNNAHINYLREYLKMDINIFSVILFSDRCELKKITLTQDNIIVAKRFTLLTAMNDIYKNAPDNLSEIQVEQVYNALLPLTKVDKQTKITHIENAKKHQEFKIKKKDEANDHICPCCNSKLVLRTAKKGNNIGNEFYGCSNYPKCRYTKSV